MQPSVEVKSGFDWHGKRGFWVIADHECWQIFLYREMAEACANTLRVGMLWGFRPFVRKGA